MKRIIAALIAIMVVLTFSSPVTAGDRRGDQSYMMTLKGSETTSFYIYPRGNRELMVLFVQGDSSSDVDCLVEDGDGEQISSDQSPSDTCSIAFRTVNEQRMTVTLTNFGKKDNQLVIFTN